MNRWTGVTGGVDESPTLRGRKPVTVVDEREEERASGRGTARGNSDEPIGTLVGEGADGGSCAPPLPPLDLHKKVHFSASVEGGLSSADGEGPVTPDVVLRTFGTGIPTSHPAHSTNFIPAGTQPQPVPAPRGGISIDPTLASLPDSSPSNSASSSRVSFERSPPQATNAKLSHSPPRAVVGKPGSSPPRSAGMKPGSSPPGTGHGLGHGRHASVSSTASASSRAHASHAPRHSPPQPPAARMQPPPPPPTTSSFSSNASTYVSATAPYPAKSSVSPTYPTSNQPLHGGYPAHPGGPYAPPPPVQVPPPPPPPMELTSMQIAKAQKHCRFAISALEYEDAEQARKELRAALAVLGER